MKKIISIAIAIVVIGGSFYGGMLYGQSKKSMSFGPQDFQRNTAGNFQKGTVKESVAAIFNGEVTAKDEQSLTLKMADGSSKIIFFSASTKISKMAEGSASDVEIGKQIMATGTKNSDGSYTAATIQLSPRVQP